MSFYLKKPESTRIPNSKLEFTVSTRNMLFMDLLEMLQGIGYRWPCAILGWLVETAYKVSCTLISYVKLVLQILITILFAFGNEKRLKNSYFKEDSLNSTLLCSRKCKEFLSFTICQFQPQPQASLVVTQLAQNASSKNGKKLILKQNSKIAKRFLIFFPKKDLFSFKVASIFYVICILKFWVNSDLIAVNNILKERN